LQVSHFPVKHLVYLAQVGSIDLQILIAVIQAKHEANLGFSGRCRVEDWEEEEKEFKIDAFGFDFS
jgi:hypothetical protein